MAMSGPVLANAILAAIGGNTTATRTAAFNALATAIVAHIQANALVTVTVASVSGVTTGPGASGPGTGVGTIS